MDVHQEQRQAESLCSLVHPNQWNRTKGAVVYLPFRGHLTGSQVYY